MKENSRSGSSESRVSVPSDLGIVGMMVEENSSPSTAIIVLHWDPKVGMSIKRGEPDSGDDWNLVRGVQRSSSLSV